MKQVPTGALIVILVAWAGGAFAGGLVASAGARRGKTARAMVFAGLFLLGTLANLMMIPHPVWVQAIGLAEIVPAAYFGSTLTGPRTKDSKPEVAAELA